MSLLFSMCTFWDVSDPNILISREKKKSQNCDKVKWNKTTTTTTTPQTTTTNKTKQNTNTNKNKTKQNKTKTVSDEAVSQVRANKLFLGGGGGPCYYLWPPWSAGASNRSQSVEKPLFFHNHWNIKLWKGQFNTNIHWMLQLPSHAECMYIFFKEVLIILI